MKNKIQKTSKSKNFILFATLFTLMIVSLNSFAATGKQDPGPGNYSVKYKGTSPGGIVFHLTYDNPQATRFEVILKNQDGTTLFQKFFSDKALEKDIVLTKDLDLNNVSFIVKAGKKDLIQNFNIQTKTIEVLDVQPAE